MLVKYLCAFRLLVSTLVALSLVSCTSMRLVRGTDPQSLRAAVKVGDEVSVSATNGKTYLLKLIEVDADRIVGIGDNKKVTIPYGQIAALEVRRVSAARTLGLGAALYVVIGLIVVLVAFNEAFDDL